MELLDKENHQETYEYTIIGGYSSNLTRIPSTLGYRSATPSPNTSHAKCLRCQGTGRVGTGLSKSSSNSSGSEEVDAPSPVAAAALPLRWDEEEVMSWLKEKGFHIYEVQSTLPLHPPHCSHIPHSPHSSLSTPNHYTALTSPITTLTTLHHTANDKINVVPL